MKAAHSGARLLDAGGRINLRLTIEGAGDDPQRIRIVINMQDERQGPVRRSSGRHRLGGSRT